MDEDEYGQQGPTYWHDCPYCISLGTWHNHYSDTLYDLWYHGEGMPTLIARYSSDGPDYQSGMVFATTDAEIAIAYARASRRGLVDNTTKGV